VYKRQVFSWGVGTLLVVSPKEAPRGMSVPKRVPDISSVKGATRALSAGPEHAAALVEGNEKDKGDEVRMWGSNEFAQMGVAAKGLAATTDKCHPLCDLRGAPLRKVSMVACGGAHSLAISDGQLFAWGTGTVGQLGLKSDIQVQETPIAVALPLSADKKPQEVAACYAGMVSSACLTAAGDCCMWGDNSQGRLGLDSGKGKGGGGGGGGVPMFVNDAGAVVWEPTLLRVTHEMYGEPKDSAARAHIVHVALGGAFSLFLVHKTPAPAAAAAAVAAGGDAAGGCILLVSGCLGIDITRDTYGYNTDTDAPEVINGLIDDEIKEFELPRAGKGYAFAPRAVAPLGTEACVFGCLLYTSPSPRD
jgi:hypothetical protein